MAIENDSLKVVVDERLSADKALKKFKRICESFGVVKEYRRRQAYQKPSVKMKEKREAAEKRRRKTMFKSSRSSGGKI